MSDASDARRVLELVYGEPVQKPATEEMAAARRVLAKGATVETVRLMMLIAGSSPKFWGPMFETSCARGYGVRRLEEQMKGLQLALSRDPSAPGNRAGEAAYGTYEDPRGPEVDQHIEKTLEEKRAEVQRPWLELIAEAQAIGLRGPAMFDWVMSERARRTGRPRSDYPQSTRLVGAIGTADPRVAAALETQRKERGRPSVDAPRHWTETSEADPADGGDPRHWQDGGDE